MLSRQAIERAAAVLARGGVVILPTDTVPGLFVTDTPANEKRLRGLKERRSTKPFARMFGSRAELRARVRVRSKLQERALERLLPGRITLVLPARGGGTLGVRLPMDASLRALIRRTGPLIATSANLSGEELGSPARLPARLLRKVELVEEDASGVSQEPVASTVVDLTASRPVVLRKGAVSIWTTARRLGATPYLKPPLRLNVVFVCGGNTCRSPMAELLLKKHCLLRRLNVASAGLSAANGLEAAAFAKKTMQERGFSLADHRSRELTPALMRWADVVLVMTREHLLRIRRTYERFADRTFLLSGFPAPWPHGRNIADPIGGSLQIYRRTAEQIHSYIGVVCSEFEKVLRRAD